MGKLRVLFDTSAIRDFAEGTRDGPRLRELLSLKQVATFHLTELAVVELSEQLLSKRLDFDVWNAAKPFLEELIDRREPVVAPAEDLFTLDAVDESIPRGAKQQRYLNTRWHHLMHCSSLEEFLRPVEMTTDDGKFDGYFQLKPYGAKNALARAREGHASSVERFVSSNAEKHLSVNAIVEATAAWLDPKIGERERRRIEPYVRARAHVAVKAMSKSSPYKPRSKKRL